MPACDNACKTTNPKVARQISKFRSTASDHPEPNSVRTELLFKGHAGPAHGILEAIVRPV
jgi:hypothetical protein